MNDENYIDIKPTFYSNLLNGLNNIKDKYIYRYINIDHLIRWYRAKELFLTKPEKWDDPFENILMNAEIKFPDGSIKKLFQRNFIYGQCWTLKNQKSDIF